MSELQLFVRDKSLTRWGQLDQFTRLEVTRSHQDVGSWEIELDADHSLVDYLIANGAGIEILRDGEMFCSGPIWRRVRERSGEANSLTLSGPDDSHVVWDRVAHPQPTSSAPPYSSQAYDTRTGVASTVIRQFVDYNAGPSAISTRRAAGLTLAADPLTGSTITGLGRWQNLGEFIRELAQTDDLGFDVMSTGDGSREFRVYAPTDLTDTVQFSLALGNLAEYSYEIEASTGNYGYGLGQGEGLSRTVVERSDSSSITTWSRVEFVQDRRDTATSTEIIQSLDEELTQQASRVSLQFTPLDTEALAYGVDYNLGDRVAVEIEGIRIERIIRQITAHWTDQGEVITPIVGDADAAEPNTAHIFDQLRRTNRVVRDLVRR